MLASARDYLAVWQIPFILVFIVAWIFGGADLLRLALRKKQPVARISFGSCIWAFLLAGLAAVFGAVVFLLLAVVIASRMGISPLIPAVVIALPVMLFLAILTVYATLPLSFKSALQAAALPLVCIAIFGVAIAGIVGPTAWYLRQERARRDISIYNLQMIFWAIDTYQRKFYKPPQDLRTLAELNLIEAKNLTSRTAPGKEIGFYYLPAGEVRQKGDGDKMIACDLPPNPKGKGRVVLMENGLCYWAPYDEFRDILARKKNAYFADELNNIERN